MFYVFGTSRVTKKSVLFSHRGRGWDIEAARTLAKALVKSDDYSQANIVKAIETYKSFINPEA